MKTKIGILTLACLSFNLFGQTVQESIDKLTANATAIESVVNGPAAGAGSVVDLPGGGTQDTLAKMALQFDSAGALRYNLAQTLSEGEKTQLGANWPEALENLTESELQALGFVKLVNGKIPVSFLPDGFATPAQLLAAREDITYIPIYGQSLANGNTGTTVVTTGSVSDFVISFRGDPKARTGEFDSFLPLVENNRASPETFTSGEIGAAQAGLYLINYANGLGATLGPKYQFQATGRGSAAIEQLVKGHINDYYNTFFLPPLVGLGDLADTGSLSSTMPLMIFRQGEQSSAIRAPWKADLETIRNDIMEDSNANLSVASDLKIVSYQTGTAGSLSSAGSILGQWDCFNQEDWFTISSPNYPMYGGDHYAIGGDNIHLTSAGYAWLGAYDGRAAAKFLYENKKSCTYPVSAIAAGWTVTVTYNVPVPPLVVDTSLVPAVQDFGFKVVDDIGTLTLSNIQVATANTITFDTNRAISTNGMVRFGVDYPFTGSLVPDGVATNIRDSDTETVTIATIPRTLHNWSLQGDISVNEDTVDPPITDNLWVLDTGVSSYDAIVGTDDLTELGTTPTAFTATGLTIETTESLDTGVAVSGTSATAWAVVKLDTTWIPADPTSQSAAILNNKNGTFNSDGFSIVHSRQLFDSGGPDEELLNKFTLYSVNDGGGHNTSAFCFAPDVDGYVVVGITYDATLNERTLFINPEKAWNSGVTTSTVSLTWAGHLNSDTLEIGRGSYTHSASLQIAGTEIALVGYANEHADAATITAILEDANTRVLTKGITTK